MVKESRVVRMVLVVGMVMVAQKSKMYPYADALPRGDCTSKIYAEKTSKM